MQSLEDQLACLKQTAIREKLSIAETFVESHSAKEPGTRPQFEALMDKIQKGEINSILTWHINRLTRNMVDGGTLAHLLYAGKLKFIMTPERIYRPEDNVLLLAIENGMATSYVHDLSRAVKRGMTGKAERGWFPGRAPLGYRNNPYTKEIDPDPDRFHLLQAGWRMLISERLPIREVHRRLTRLGLTTLTRTAAGSPVAFSALHSIFRNPFYTGLFPHGGELHQGRHLPMVSRQEFQLAQEVIESRRGKYLKRTHEHQYAGMIRCAKCGCLVCASTVIKRRKDGTSRKYTYYTCSGRKGCNKCGVSEQEVSEAALKAMEAAALPADAAEWCKKSIRNQFEQAEGLFGQSENAVKEKLERAQTRLDRLMAVFLDGELGRDDFQEAQEKLKAEVATLKQSLAATAATKERMIAWIDGKLDAAVKANHGDILTPSLRRTTLLSIGDNHVLEGGKIRFEVDPVLETLSVFKPSKNGSHKGEPGTFSTACPFWLGIMSEIQKRAGVQTQHSDPPLLSIM